MQCKHSKSACTYSDNTSDATLTTKAADVMFILIDDHISIPTSLDSTLSGKVIVVYRLNECFKFFLLKVKQYNETFFMY